MKEIDNSYLFALATGVLAAVALLIAGIGRLEASFLLVLAGAYGVLGALFSIGWPHRSWQWGIWLSLPSLFFPAIALLSMLYTAYFYLIKNSSRSLVYFGRPAAISLVAFIGASIGAFIGSKLSPRRRRQKESQ